MGFDSSLARDARARAYVRENTNGKSLPPLPPLPPLPSGLLPFDGEAIAHVCMNVMRNWDRHDADDNLVGVHVRRPDMRVFAHDTERHPNAIGVTDDPDWNPPQGWREYDFEAAVEDAAVRAERAGE